MSDPSPWISVGELAQAFSADSNAPQLSADLAGRDYALYLEDGRAVKCHFLTPDRLTWQVDARPERRSEEPESYFAIKARPGIYLVDFARRIERATTITLVLDLEQRIVTVLIAQLPDKKDAVRALAERAAAGTELTAVSAKFLSGAIDSPFNPETPRHQVTRDLIGRRVEYTYSTTERYEHIYLNEDFYTWQCLAGAEKGLADTDRCHYYKLAENLYFFVWREKIVPTIGAAVIDYERMKSAGKIFGYRDDDFSQTVDFAMGANARLLNITKHDST